LICSNQLHKKEKKKRKSEALLFKNEVKQQLVCFLFHFSNNIINNQLVSIPISNALSAQETSNSNNNLTEPKANNNAFKKTYT
jgi:hypothetical protein